MDHYITSAMTKHGLLLINLGTPDSCQPKDVRRYLREFLSDRRVIQLPTLLRYILLYGIIIPFRTRRSTRAYQQIWLPQGSPLLVYSQQLVAHIAAQLAPHYTVVLGMRYGNPSISAALTALEHCEHITVLPLYPQYSESATGSALERVFTLLAQQAVIPSLTILRDFYTHPDFIIAEAQSIAPYIATHDYILFSYHGLPASHLTKLGCKPICTNACPSINSDCYRAQCFTTTRLIAEKLQLPTTQYATVFQSQLGKTAWIQPYLNDTLQRLAELRIKRLAITCPSFVTDCLETLEEIGIRAKNTWQALGGETLTLIPALNTDPLWINAILAITNNNTQ